MSCAPFSTWKEEPLSPLSTEEVSWLSEDTFYQTSQEHDDCLKFEHDLVPCESKAEVASLMLENLENLINLDELIKEGQYVARPSRGLIIMKRRSLIDLRYEICMGLVDPNLK
jgi:hypothetical protein